MRQPARLLLAAFSASVLVSAATAARQGAPAGASAPAKRAPVPEVFEVVRVVDADTLHIHRNGQLEKLRLLSVDTEERLGTGYAGSQTKPQTVFGEECAQWAQRFFKDLGGEDGVARIGVLFPGGVEQRDMFGRLLCHVILADGTDFNLLLVEKGKSPYFNKYGNSEVCHEAFVAAQRAAQAAQLGIWNPATNEPKTPGTPAAKRPYPELLAWWSARAAAIEGFRERHAADPAHVVSAEDRGGLAGAARSGEEVEVFGSIDRTFEESNGDLTLRFESSAEEHALRVRIPHRLRELHAALDLDGRRQELRQNYLYVRGEVRAGRRGPELVSESPEQWRPAGPEPQLPAVGAGGSATAGAPPRDE